MKSILIILSLFISHFAFGQGMFMTAFFNKKASAACPAQTTNHCVLDATASGSSAGYCGSSYGGACSFSCNNGTWTSTSNTCVSGGCGGTMVGGACRYLAPAGTNCFNACNHHNGYIAATDINYGGSAGTNANCKNLLAAFGFTGINPSDQSGCGDGYGCEVLPSISYAFRCTSPDTNGGATPGSTGQRFCTCAN